MNEEEMKELWLNQAGSVNMNAGLVEELQGRVETLNKKIKWRDKLETGIALLMAFLFLLLVFLLPPPIAKIGSGLIVISMLMIVFVLRKNRKKEPETQASLKEQIEEELRFLRKQRYILNNVVYWYLLPSFIVISLFFFGLKRSYFNFFIHEGIIILICVGVWYVNRLAVRKEIKPSIQSLEQLLHKLTKA